jgi:hypothetical protein
MIAACNIWLLKASNYLTNSKHYRSLFIFNAVINKIYLILNALYVQKITITLFYRFTV